MIDCQVVRHQHYGLVTTSMEGRVPGYVDASAIGDELSVGMADWPPVGSVIRCVVLGHRRDGRLNLSCRPRDVELVCSVSDIGSSLDQWSVIRDAPAGSGSLLEWVRSSDAVPILRWAFRRPANSVDHRRVAQLIEVAPADLARRITEQ